MAICVIFFQVEVIYMRESLPDEYTLMDVAYIYTWKRVSTLPHYSKICYYFYYTTVIIIIEVFRFCFCPWNTFDFKR
jgi:hypothetical protein